MDIFILKYSGAQCLKHIRIHERESGVANKLFIDYSVYASSSTLK